VRSASFINPLIGTLKPQSNGPLYSDRVIGTLAVDRRAVTVGTARGLGGLRPVYQLHVIGCDTIIAFAL